MRDARDPARCPQETVELSFCVVNTSQRELLLRGLDAIARERAGLPFATEVLVLDNGSRDGSAEAAAAHAAVDETIAIARAARQGAQRLASCCGARAGAMRCCSTRTPSCCPAPRSRSSRRCRSGPQAACAGARLLRPDGTRAGLGVALSDAADRARRRAVRCTACVTVQSRGERIARGRLVPVGRAARAPRGRRGGRLPGPATSSSTPTRSTSRGACATPAGAACTCPAAVAIHHEQLSTRRGAASGGSSSWRATATCTCASTTRPAAARAVRWLTAWSLRAARARRARAARATRRARYWRHVTATLRPQRGEGLREAAAEYNRDGRPRAQMSRRGSSA